jgi:hypothetical protein
MVSFTFRMRKLFFLVLTALSLIPSIIRSQATDTLQSGERVALLIGNGNYLNGSLANPENDARAMAEVLRKVGFKVFEYENLTRRQMESAIDEFGLGLKKNDIALFFYAGHGIQSKGYNYLIPVDASLKSEALVDFECVRADRILALFEESGTQVNIMLLDACRNNPFERSWTRAASGKGLATMDAPTGTLIGYATAPGSTASDGSGNNGLYTSALLESIIIPGISISQVFYNVTRIVTEKSGKEQRPWTSSSLTAEFYFSNEKALAPGTNEQIQTKETGKTDNTVKSPVSANSKSYPKINGAQDWEKVQVINKEDRELVSGLTPVSTVRASSSYGGLAGSSKGRSNCIRDLRKRAAELGCPVVLIVNEQTGITTKIEGMAYK